MDDLELLLKSIKEHPRLYLGEKSIILLKACIGGFVEGKKTEKIEFQQKFQSYIEKPYPSNGACSWAKIILFNSLSEVEAVDTFYELLD
jgi:rRNA pseudouridine-1189 N-methylase Emg1 (Nep1/Mra1 family)